MTGPEGRAVTGQRRNAEQRRARIVDAARMLFARQGFHGTGMAQIARESDVLVGQIYRDFASKEDLIAALVEQDITALLDDPDLTEAIAAADSQRLRTWIATFIASDPREETRCLFADVAAEANRNPRIAAILAGAQIRLRERLRQALRMLASGPDDAAACTTVAELIFTLGSAMLNRRVCAAPGDDAAIADKFIRLIDGELDRLESGALSPIG